MSKKLGYFIFIYAYSYSYSTTRSQFEKLRKHNMNWILLQPPSETK